MIGEHEHHHELELSQVEVIVQAELTMVETSRSGGRPIATDAELPFDVAAVLAYEVRLKGLRDAVTVVKSRGDPV